MQNYNVIYRNFNRTENDDFILNVQPKLGKYLCATPIIVDDTVLGWFITGMYE